MLLVKEEFIVGLFSRIFGKKKKTCPCCEHKEEVVAPVEEEKVEATVAEEKTEEVVAPVVEEKVEEVKSTPAKKPAAKKTTTAKKEN